MTPPDYNPPVWISPHFWKTKTVSTSSANISNHTVGLLRVNRRLTSKPSLGPLANQLTMINTFLGSFDQGLCVGLADYAPKRRCSAMLVCQQEALLWSSYKAMMLQLCLWLLISNLDHSSTCRVYACHWRWIQQNWQVHRLQLQH